MKKTCFIFVAVIASVAAVLVTLFCLPSGRSTGYDYLRIHIRANSNDYIDQNVKYKVRDEAVKFITPLAAKCTDKQKAISVITQNLSGIEETCNRVLKANGFAYTATASVREEDFPTRVYGDLTLEQGVYDALIIELGSGTGDNWWCVIYPPLCFTSGTADVKYRSAILEIIDKFKKRVEKAG